MDNQELSPQQVINNIPPQIDPLLTKRSLKRYIIEHWIHIPIFVLILIPIIFVVTIYKYQVLGAFFTSNYPIQLVDIKTDQPIIGATITLGKQTAVTNNNGLAIFRGKVGKFNLSIQRKYYQTLSRTAIVPFTNHGWYTIHLSPTGIEVPVQVSNRLNNKPISALISVAGIKAMSNKRGVAYIALSQDLGKQSATLIADGYNDLTTPLTISTGLVKQNRVAMIPKGLVWYGANISPGFAIVSSNLDGSNQKVVMGAATNMTAANTVVLPSPDLKYVAVLTDRGSGQNLYLINTSTGKYSDIDKTTGSYNLIGWTPNDSIVYTVKLTNLNLWDSGNNVINAYDAVHGKEHQLFSAESAGYSQYVYDGQVFSQVGVLPNNSVIYTVTAVASDPSYLTERNTEIDTINVDGTKQSTIYSITSDQANATTFNWLSPTELDILLNGGSAGNIYFTYQNGKLNKTTDKSVQSSFSSPVTTNPYFVTPDTKYELFASGSKLVQAPLSSSNYTDIYNFSQPISSYGWFSDNYVFGYLGSQLYVVSSGIGGGQIAQPLLVSNVFAIK